MTLTKALARFRSPSNQDHLRQNPYTALVRYGGRSATRLGPRKKYGHPRPASEINNTRRPSPPPTPTEITSICPLPAANTRFNPRLLLVAAHNLR